MSGRETTSCEDMKPAVVFRQQLGESPRLHLDIMSTQDLQLKKNFFSEQKCSVLLEVNTEADGLAVMNGMTYM